MEMHQTPQVQGGLLDGFLARLILLEQQQETIQKEVEDLRTSNRDLSDRIQKSIWVSEAAAAILTLFAGPFRKGIEIAIGAIILYLITHIRFTP